MDQTGKIQTVWNSYWFRTLITGFPVGLIVALLTWVSGTAELSTVGYFILMLAVLMGYGFLIEERYLKPWRRETVGDID